MTFDVGPNLSSLGWAFLLLKYALPFIFGLILLGAGYFVLRRVLTYYKIDLSNRNQLLVLAFVAVILFALLNW